MRRQRRSRNTKLDINGQLLYHVDGSLVRLLNAHSVHAQGTHGDDDISALLHGSTGIIRHHGWQKDCVAIVVKRVQQETDCILHPEARERLLFGRLVKRTACFELIREGAQELVPGAKLKAADDNLAVTALMRQLAAEKAHTVA